LLLLLLLATTTLAAAEQIDIAIISPAHGQPVYGEIEVRAEVVSDVPVIRVELHVDGSLAATCSQRPYRFKVDVGDENVEHSFEVVAVAASGARSSVRRTTPRIHVNDDIQVNLQQLYVTATLHGEPVHDLRQEEFKVYDERKPQQIVTFARGDIPFTAVILVDSSTSMLGDKQDHALLGAREFAGRMKTLDEAKLIVFADSIRAVSPFTSYSEVLTASLGRFPAAGGTAINDVLYLGLTQLEQRQGRRVVVLLSDGVDTHSAMQMRHVMPCFRRSRALVYFIRTRSGSEADDSEPGEPPTASSPWRDHQGYRTEFKQLLRAVDDSGGRLLEVASPAGIQTAFGDIVNELRDHYVLGYYPSNRRNDGSWHKVRVEVSRPGVEIRTSSGYIDLS
jgi:Ca-activated chloride channel family protein